MQSLAEGTHELQLKLQPQKFAISAEISPVSVFASILKCPMQNNDSLFKMTARNTNQIYLFG